MGRRAQTATGFPGVAVPVCGVTLSQLADTPEMSETDVVKFSEPPPELETISVWLRADEVVA